MSPQVDCNDDHISDTEELLERTASEFEFGNRLETSCTTPPIDVYHTDNENAPSLDSKPETTPPETRSRLLNVEEFSCDVSLEEATDNNKPDRQEFSFTLYDFDGRGKITKDDIAGLVTTIYEALGSSIEMPHFGSKTIKVKLTVSPNIKREETETRLNENLEDILTKKDFNVTIRHVAQDRKKQCRYHQKQKELKTHYCCRKLQETNDFVDSSDDYSDVCSNISSDDEETEIYSNIRTCKTNVTQKQCNKHSTSDIKNSINVTTKDCVDNSHSNICSKTKKLNKRSMSLQRQELLEILQANMDKNNLSFHTKRKPCVDHVVLDSQKPQNQNYIKQHKHRHKTVRFPSVPFQCLANVINPTHLYVDLASLQNTTQLPNTTCQYGQLIDAVMCVSNKQITTKRSQGCHRHVRLKYPESTNNNVNPFQYHLVDSSFMIPDGIPKITKKTKTKCESEATPAVKKNIRKFPQVVLGHTSSPHHLRHRNRQEDKARAMAQVVRWLEQEFSSNLHATSDNEDKTKSTESRKSPQDDKGENSPTDTKPNVERHEHHHVHEHIHHHYHHYQETPVVV
ncbi:protein naked cuticle homolog 2 [Agrilus planipennis]|uniref:Protein naked cuticle homolog n=1 Tax=Agrilus planipennis TaxID=224129 RepID=A0A7F5RI58_AGRPL|nr:protein naked cuticle homolog 2 [Agrilus planipennis]